MVRRSPIVEYVLLFALMASWFAASARAVDVGPVSLAGFLAGFIALSAAATWMPLAYVDRIVWRPVSYLAAFVCLAAARTFYEDTSTGAVMNIGVWAGVLFLFLASATAVRASPPLVNSLLVVLRLSVLVVTAVLAVSYLVGTRNAATSMVAMFPVATLLAAPSASKLYRITLLLSLLLLVASAGSRTPAFVLLLFIPLSQLLWAKGNQALKSVLVTFFLAAGAGGVAFVAFEYLDSFRQSFLHGDGAVHIGGYAINTSGRWHYWGIVWESILERPILGHGISVPDQMRHLLAWTHPHNDYLRLLHQLGAVGLTLWLAFYLRSGRIILRAVRGLPTVARHSPEGALLTVTLLCLVGFSILMITDNPIVYSYIVYPVSILAGASLGAVSVMRNSQDGRGA